MNAIVAFAKRWLEHWWLLALAGAGVAVWIVVGAIDRTATVDALALLVQLPLVSTYALAACALTYLVRRRWRRKLSDDEQADWWQRLMDGQLGPAVVYVVDALVTLCVLYWLLAFFSPVR